MHEKSLEQLNREMEAAETDPFTVRRYAQFVKHLPTATNRILDVGCNTGRGGSVIRSRFPSSVLDGVDLVPEYVAKMAPGVYDELAGGFLQDYEPAQGNYDAVLMGEVIEHVPLNAIDPVFDAVKRLLRPGGLLLLTTPNPHYFLLGRRNGGTILGGAHVSPHCPVALRQYLRYVGFDVEVLTGTGRVSALVGTRLPMFVYGSYLIVAKRP